MRISFTLYLCAVLASIIWIGPPTRPAVAASAEGDLYVAANGSDSNPGTFERPFATLVRARDAVRKLKKDGEITVLLRGGTYRLCEPLVFGATDSGSDGAPVTYAAYPGEEVVVKGSLAVKGNWKPWRDGIFSCSLRETALEGKPFNQLFCDGVRMVRARCPNWDFEDPLRSGGGYFNVQGGSTGHMMWKAGQLDGKTWADPTTGIVHCFHRNNWGNMQYRIGAVDWERRRIDFAGGGLQCQRRVGPGKGRGSSSPYYIENVFEELDAAHEWFLDSEKDVLYFYPPIGVDPAKAQIEAAVAKRLISFRGSVENPVHHIRLRGLHFTQTGATFMEEYDDLARGDWAVHRGGAAYLAGAEDCRIEDCLFEQCGGNGIFVDGYNRRVEITGCLLHNLGDSAVCFVGSPGAVREYQTWSRAVAGVEDLEPGPKSDDYPAGCAVRDCIMHDVGVFGKQTSGVLVSMSMDITISHCSIYNIPRAGITFNDGTWGGHVLEYCDIWNTVTETGEHGPFNSWGRERFWRKGTLDKATVLLDAMKTVHIRNNRISNFRKSVSAGNWTIDLDDGSSNFHIYNNLSLGSTLKLRDGFFRRVWNNIHVSGVPLGWHVWPEDNGDVFEKNITVISGCPVGEAKPQTNFLRPARMPKHPWGRRHASNLWWNLNTKEFSLAGMSWEKWRDLGYGEDSVFADPLFVDPANGDYRVRAGSPALKLGFKNFPMDRFGHRQTRIEPFGGQFEETVSVTLRPDIRGGNVRFTLDGSRPTANSPLCTQPLLLEASTTIRAQTFEDGIAIGFEAKAFFEKVERVERPAWLRSLLAGRWVAPDETASAAETAKRRLSWHGARLTDILDGDMIDSLGGHEFGVFVSDLEKRSPLYKAGLRRYDLIIETQGRRTDNITVFLRQLQDAEGKTTIRAFRGYEKVAIVLPAGLNPR